MKHYILIATTNDRWEMLVECLDSIKKYLNDWRVVVVSQGYSEQRIIKLNEMLSFTTSLNINIAENVGMHNAKMIGLEYINNENKYDAEKGRRIHKDCILKYVVMSSDDDMVFTSRTTLDKSLEFVDKVNVGFVSLGWVRHKNQLHTYNAVDEFVKQKIVYTGGGMLFQDDIAQLLLSEPKGNYISDNALWSILSYANGYDNYRYRGSCTIHNICRTGGRKAWVKGSDTKIKGREELLEYKESVLQKNNKYDYLIPDSSCVKELADKKHKKFKK